MKSYSYTFKNNIIKHNIPESLIVNLDQINYRIEQLKILDRTYMLIDEKELEMLDDYIMWSTENSENEDIDKGVLFIRHQDDVIVTRICASIDFDGKYYLLPLKEIINNGITWKSWPSRPVKIFNNYYDFVEDRVKKHINKIARNNKN